jgi:UDP-N-acetylenolpyruvoylglucosamine reductase
VIYTAAHQGKLHPLVQEAQQKNIPVFSHAEALSFFFNEKQGIAVCGVGGKSTVSAMISWILEKTGHTPSFSVGVGDIVGLGKTGQWKSDSAFFVAEADEYVTDPATIQQGETAIPRFSYLQPYLTVCTHLEFDHPDVYKDEQHTIDTFNTFFSQLKDGGALIINKNDVNKVKASVPIKTFGMTADADLTYTFDENNSQAGSTRGTCTFNGKTYPVTLQVPGQYNIENAAAALLACQQIGVSLDQSISALASFQSTSRRFEKKGQWHGVPLYDDYAHHPSEITAVLSALKNWYPQHRKVVAFQPHTYSRTKSLFSEFVESFKDADVVIILDIFASARESADPSISSAQLVQEISKNFPQMEVWHTSTPESLAQLCREKLKPNDVLLTIGAGDIYKMYDYLNDGTTEIQQLFSSQFSNLSFITNHPLAAYTTVKIGGPAELFVEINNKQDLIDVALFAHSNGIPVTVLGWGANSLISDEGIKGLVIKNNSQTITIHDQETTENALLDYSSKKVEPRWNASKAPEAPSYEFTDLDYSEEGAERVLVTLDAGVSLPAAINTLLAKGITGLQWYARIPASVGGAVYNNIHGGTHFIGETLVAVDVLTENNEHKRYSVDQLDLAYDYSVFHKNNDILLSADFMLYKGDVQKAQSAAIEWAKRKQVQPQNSLGCVFQNITAEEQKKLSLPTPSIGYLIQHTLGLQGFRIGDAQVSTRHAAFIENVGQATAADYLAIIKKIIKDAKDKCGLNLKTEIFFLGFTIEQLEGIVHSRSS